MKKFLLSLLCLLLALCCLGSALAETTTEPPVGYTSASEFDSLNTEAAPAEAPVEYTSGEYTYIILPDGTAEIIRYTPSITLFDVSLPIELTIPSELDGYPVTSIGNEAFYKHDILGNVTLPEGILSIGDRAFSECLNLESITLPEGVLSIGAEAFAHCPFRLTNVVIPEGVTSIGNNAFYFCTALTNITLPDTLTSIGDLAFFNCPLTSIALPNSLTSLGTNPFVNCPLSEIILSEEHPVLEVIDGVLFDKQSKTLIFYPYVFPNTSYEIPQGTLAIGASAFHWCDNLTSVSIPDSVSHIGDDAFYWCKDLVFTVTHNSYAETYAKENNISYTIK